MKPYRLDSTGVYVSFTIYLTDVEYIFRSDVTSAAGYTAERSETYGTLLRTLAMRLGLPEKESNEVAAEACLLAGNSYGVHSGVSLKIWLTRIVVRRCVFRIS